MDDQHIPERVAERLLEDEALRAELTDAEARVLLDWALDRVTTAADPDAALADVRIVARAVNQIVGQRESLERPALAARLRRLTGQPAPAPLSFWRRWLGRRDPVDELLDRLPTLAGPDLVRAVLALVPSPHPEDRS